MEAKNKVVPLKIFIGTIITIWKSQYQKGIGENIGKIYYIRVRLLMYMFYVQCILQPSISDQYQKGTITVGNTDQLLTVIFTLVAFDPICLQSCNDHPELPRSFSLSIASFIYWMFYTSPVICFYDQKFQFFKAHLLHHFRENVPLQMFIFLLFFERQGYKSKQKAELNVS